MKKWQPFSWQQYPIMQNVDYCDLHAVENCVTELKNLPPLVTEQEIKNLKQLIHSAAQGEAFILQGGDCAEAFADCTLQHISHKFEMLRQMSELLIDKLKKPVIRIGRIAGQYAKPRSLLEETINGVTLPAYRGDLINHHEFTPEARTPDPQRLLLGYRHAQLTLNCLSALAADAPLFTSHEALHLPYEAALTREDAGGNFYNASTHFPWIGMRTLRVDSAHVEYLRGIQNPIGIKVAPNVDFAELLTIVRILNPQNESGKIVLIHRFGKDYIAEKLPKLLQQITQEKLSCALICDPMHGNTRQTNAGIKTRYLQDILDELKLAFEIHQQNAVPLAGVHIEMTHENVTECIGGSVAVTEADLGSSYKSLLDPRLNYQQALELVAQL